MKERPIIFQPANIRSLLAGTKTQTRRVCKPAEAQGLSYVVDCRDGTWGNEEGDEPAFQCPYGKPGDRLWVRESHWWFKDEHDHETGYFPPPLTVDDVEYRADGDDGRKAWRPSIHMPRWASRILLEITEIRVQRLLDIGEADCLAEGAPGGHGVIPGYAYAATPFEHYRAVWEQINGAGSWDANPWVWAVTFRRAGARAA